MVAAIEVDAAADLHPSKEAVALPVDHRPKRGLRVPEEGAVAEAHAIRGALQSQSAAAAHLT